jgi:transposase
MTPDPLSDPSTAGNLAKVGLIAVARKLLTILNAMIRDNRPWQDTLASA